MSEDARLWMVGELAAAAGVTVRALHHYDELGLRRPSERSPRAARRDRGAQGRLAALLLEETSEQARDDPAIEVGLGGSARARDEALWQPWSRR